MADLFDVVVARKLSGGGGGSSDFSTAEVIVDNSSPHDIYLCVIDDDGLYSGVVYDLVTVPLYKGKAYGYIKNISSGTIISTSGGVTYDGFLSFCITGDGTITVSGT